MYEEGHRGFAFKSIVLKLLLIVIVVFLIIWLFPTKNYVKNLIDSKLGTGKDQVFTTNVETMKNAAVSYFSGNRLPSKNGDSKRLTLKEMIDNNLITDIKDSNGKKCNYKESYVKVTKNENDYKLKVNLVCADKTAYIYSYIGSQDYCTSDVCSKKKLADNETKTEKTNTESKKETTESSKTTSQCEYVKEIKGYMSYGNWSSWSTNAVQKTNTRDVETKVEKIQTGTVTEQSGTTKHTQEPKKVTIVQNGKQKVVYICPSNFDNGGSYNYYVTCVKTMPNYVEKPTYQNVTVYRYRDKKYISDNNSYKWSSCNDDSLIKQGYKATGKTK